MRFILFIMGLLGSFWYGYSQKIYTLDELIGVTMKQNFDIRIAQINAEIANNNNVIGNAGFLPSVVATSGYDVNRFSTQQEFINGTTQEVDQAKRELFNAGATAAWRVFDGTRMFVMKTRLEKQALQQYMAYKTQVDARLADVMRFFYQVAFENERQQLFESNLAFSDERVRIVEQSYMVGKLSKLDLLQAKVDYNTDKTSLVTQQESLAAQKLALLQAIGLTDEPTFSIVYELEIDTTLDVNQLIAASLAQNPAILAQQYAIEVARKQAVELDKSRYPTIDLNLGYQYSNLESNAGFLLRNQSNGFNYGFTARVSLFDGFNQQRVLQNARMQAEVAKIEAENVENQIITAIRITFNSYTNNLLLRKLEQENLTVATENAEIALERFKIGVSNALQLREAQVNAINAQIRYLSASFSAKLSEIELKRLSGQLTVID